MIVVSNRVGLLLTSQRNHWNSPTNSTSTFERYGGNARQNLRYALLRKLSLSCSQPQLSHVYLWCKQTIKVRITSAVAVAIMAATLAATQAAQQRLLSLSRSRKCFMAARNGLLPTHTHTHKSESALALLSREQASSCFCVKHMWWKRDGGRVRVEGWNVAPPHFSVAQRLRSAPFEFRSWFHSSWVVFQLYPNEKPVRGASKKARWRQGESETERAREIYDYTWSPLSLRNIIVYGRLLFKDLDLRPLKWLAFECIFHSTRFNLTRPNTSSLVVWVLYRRWTWKLLY